MKPVNRIAASLAAIGFLALPKLASAQTCGGLSVNPVGFSASGFALISATPTSAEIALPGNGFDKVRVLNSGTTIAFVNLGASGVVTGQTNGVPVYPGTSILLATGSATDIAAESISGVDGVYVTTGK